MKLFRTVLLVMAVGACVSACHRGDKVEELDFDVGSSVEKTLRPHNIPYQGDNTGGLIEYHYTGFPDDSVAAVFSRPEMSVRIFPIFAISYYSDDQASIANTITSANMAVSTNALRSQEKAYAVTNQLIDQFQRGKWRRFIPKDSPRVTGRSSILGLSGTTSDRDSSSPIDPALKLSLDEFTLLTQQRAEWNWIAEDRIAKLVVKNSSVNATDNPSYSIDLSFELKDAYEFYEKIHQEEWIVDRGEANAKESAEKVSAENKQLEEAAIKRGDSVLPK